MSVFDRKLVIRSIRLIDDVFEINPTLWNQVLKYLSYRPRSEYEIFKYLDKKEVDKKTIEEILKKLRHYNFVNDVEFCRNWVENRTRTGKGRNFIYQELLLKGIDKQLAKTVLADNIGNEVKALNNLVGKLIGKYQSADPFETKAKLLSALARRGYSYESARQAIEKVTRKE